MREIKKFERGYDKGEKAIENKLRLVGYDVYLSESELLFSQDDFTQETLDKYFDIKTGEWYVEDGWIVAKNKNMCPGMIVSKDDYFGSVMLEITAKMVAPSTHDVNIMINGEWDDEKGRGNAYVAGMEAFWHGNLGFEKSPEYKLTAATNLFDFDPEAEHCFKLGNINGKIFVIVDGKLCLEITDPEPLDSEKYGKIGVEAFASWFKFKNVRVYKLKSERVKEYYCPEF